MSRTSASEIMRAVAGAVAIVLASAALGVLVNHLSDRGIPVLPEPGQERLALALPAGLQPLPVAEAAGLVGRAGVLFLDARTAVDYEEGHVPGAVGFPPGDFEDRYLDLADQIESASRVVAYCSGMECSDSIELGQRLLEVLPGPIYVIEAGWAGWKAAGYPVEVGAEP